MAAHDEVINADPFGLEEQLNAGKIRKLRQSNLGAADKCLLSLEFDLRPDVPYGTGESRAVGTAYHYALECYYRSRMEKGFFVPTEHEIQFYLAGARESFQFEAQQHADTFVWQDGEEAALAKIETMTRAYFAGEHYWPDDYEVVAVEHTFLAPLCDGWCVKGTVDLILRQKSTGWLIIVDHKSAKKPWKKNKHEHRQTNQPSWYVHFIMKLYDTDQVAFAFDVMTYTGAFERRQVEVLRQHIAGVLRKAVTVTMLLDRGGPFPPNTSSFLCDARWCDHWSYCPFGEEFESGVRVEIGAKN